MCVCVCFFLKIMQHRLLHLAFLPNNLGDILVAVCEVYFIMFTNYRWFIEQVSEYYQSLGSKAVFSFLFCQKKKKKKEAATAYISAAIFSLCSFVRIWVRSVPSRRPAESELLCFVNFDRYGLTFLKDHHTDLHPATAVRRPFPQTLTNIIIINSYS